MMDEDEDENMMSIIISILMDTSKHWDYLYNIQMGYKLLIFKLVYTQKKICYLY